MVMQIIYTVFLLTAKNTRTGTGDNMTSISGYFQAYSSAQTGQVTRYVWS